MGTDHAGRGIVILTVATVIAQSAVILLDIEHGINTGLPIEGVWIPVIGEEVIVDGDGNIERIHLDHFSESSMVSCEQVYSNIFTVRTGPDGSVQYNGVWEDEGRQSYRDGQLIYHTFMFASGDYMKIDYMFYDDSDCGIVSVYYCRNGFVGDHCEVEDDGTFIVNGKVVSFGTDASVPMAVDEKWDARKAYMINDDGYTDLMGNNYRFTYMGSVRGISTFICRYTEDSVDKDLVFTSVPVGHGTYINIARLGNGLLIDHMGVSDDGSYIRTVSSSYSSDGTIAIHSVSYAPKDIEIPSIFTDKDRKLLEGRTFFGPADIYSGEVWSEESLEVHINTAVEDGLEGRIRLGTEVDITEFRLICVSGTEKEYVLCNEQILNTVSGPVDIRTVLVIDKSLSHAALFMTAVSDKGISGVIVADNIEYR